MKSSISFIAISMIITSCNSNLKQEGSKASTVLIQGTWRLISGTTIEKNDTVVTSYLNGKSFIKIISKTYFAFVGHDLNKGRDSASFFSSGGGTYKLNDSTYTEHLEYCNAREWEGNDFHFKVKISTDTLEQQGVEKIDSIGVDRINIERYVRLKE